MTSVTNRSGKETRRLGRAERDIVALGIALAALILFVGTGGSVMSQVMRAWSGNGGTPDPTLTSALLLNIALIIFGWRRYKELSEEIQERRKAEELARQLAETDALTGLLNRRSFAPTSAAQADTARKCGQGIAMLMLDLDNFKHINDLHGHKTGDAVLVEVARRIELVMPLDASAARYGGDEFVIAVPFDMHRPEKLDQLAASLIASISKPIPAEGHAVEITTSIGIARSHRDHGEMTGEESVQMLLHHADIAMYHAKKQGRKGYAWFEATMESELRFRHELETGIRQGIAAGEFVPYYEQQIDLETGELVGFEMLARWHSPQFGLVSPEIFIPIAEDIGVIAELSEKLMRQAFLDAKEWDPRLSLSINISPIQLRDPWFSQKLLRLLVETGFPAHRVDIEITESCMHENIAVVRSVVASLKNQGIQISLDDFGTGYSSLAQLRTLPFDRLKIDRSFVTELAHEGANSKIVEAIISLGRGFELPITAEGIENDEVLKVLKRLGQLKGQGYLYGRPEDAAATLERLAKKNLLAAQSGAETGKKISETRPAPRARGKETASQPKRSAD